MRIENSFDQGLFAAHDGADSGAVSHDGAVGVYHYTDGGCAGQISAPIGIVAVFQKDDISIAQPVKTAAHELGVSAVIRS